MVLCVPQHVTTLIQHVPNSVLQVYGCSLADYTSFYHDYWLEVYVRVRVMCGPIILTIPVHCVYTYASQVLRLSGSEANTVL